MTDLCPVYAPFFSGIGASTAIIFCVFGASYGTAKSSIGITATSILRPDQMIRNSIPVIMAGIIAIYGLVMSILITNNISPVMPLYQAFLHLSSGLSVGLAGLAAGFSVGIVGDAGVRGVGQQPKLFMGMVLILIFSEVLGLYGLVVGLLLASRANQLAPGLC